ncbi:MAG: DUF554 domain-containing protein [Anaerolineaceae bacterium]|nr:DUF554 domain-containing protein [Anaerolineaceae bacterium]
MMIGTLLNIATVMIGGFLGLQLGRRLPERIRGTVISGLGLFTLVFGIKMFLATTNEIVVLGAILAGGLLGEWWGIEDGLQRLGTALEKRFDQGNGEQDNRFARGFLTASLVFCVGPMTILGSIQNGLSGDYSILAVKAVLDGFAALAFASNLGIGVLFSSLVILVYQGGLTLLAAQVQSVVTQAMMAEMNAAGGVILAGIAISSLLEIKKMRVGNFLPALVIAPALVAILAALAK